MSKFATILPAAAAVFMLAGAGAAWADVCAGLTSNNPNVTHFQAAPGNGEQSLTNIQFSGNSGNATATVVTEVTCQAVHQQGHTLGSGHDQFVRDTEAGVPVCSNVVDQGTRVPNPIHPAATDDDCINPLW